MKKSILALPDGFDWKHPDYNPVYLERAERLARIRSGAIDLAALKAYYGDDHPDQFIHDWGMTFDPRAAERKLPTTMPFLLFEQQQDFVLWLLERWRNRENGLGEKSRDTGVSWLCIAFGVWMWLFHPGTVIGYGSRKEEYVDDLNDPKSLFWKARNFIGLLPVEFQPAGWNPKKHAPFMSIVNPENGATMVGEAGDNIGRGNRTSIYFKDEAAFLERPESIDAALSQTTNCQIDVSTPNGEGNPFARLRKSGKVPVFTFPWQKDPRKGQEWYDKQVARLDPVVLAQEVDISYSASVANAWIPSEMVTRAMAIGPADVPRTGPWKMGVDVARFGDDKTCITLRSFRALTTVGVMAKQDTMTTAAVVYDYFKNCWAANVRIEQIAVDVIGIGAGVYDKLAQHEEFDPSSDRYCCQLVAVNSALRMDDGQNYNLRAFMWRAMKEWLAALSGPVSLKNDRTLEVDLTSLRYLYKNGLLLIESKEDAKKRGMKSPDTADSLALTFAEPVKPREKPLPVGEAWATFDTVAGY